MKRVIWCGALGVWSVAAAASPPDPEDAAYPAIERFVTVLETVRKRHPDTDLLAYDRLVNRALEGMLAGLDPHSSFIHPEMAARMQAEPGLDPEVPSLGMGFALRDDGPCVATVSPGGPAAELGVLPGSAVLEIDGKPVTADGFPEWLAALHRPPGTVSAFRLKSPAAPDPVELRLTHRLVEQRSIAEARMRDAAHHVGYIRLAAFGPGCAREMEAALDELEDNGMKALILDLSGNGGGDLGETVNILGLWLPPETTVVTIRGRDDAGREELKTPSRQRRQRDYPLAVLIDRRSASAAELTAGALQDLKRARVFGERSYGKGSVQQLIPVGGGATLRLTIATYHTPSGQTPHRKGITPDVIVKSAGNQPRGQDPARTDSLPAIQAALASFGAAPTAPPR